MTTTTPRIAVASVVALASAFALTGCVTGACRAGRHRRPRRRRRRARLRLETSADVDVRLGDEPGLELRGPRGALELLTVEEDDGVLVIGNTGPGFVIREVRATLIVTALDSLEIRGAGDVEAEFSAADSVTVSIEGAGDIEATGIDATDVEVEIRGSGDIELEGTAESASYLIAGTGDIDAGKLEVQDALAEIKGVGDITLYATDTADTLIAGTGDITVRGGAEVTRRIDGLGEIREG